MERFLRALGFLTLFPVSSPKTSDGEPLPLARAAPFFPVVGLLIALASYFVYGAASPWLPERVRSLLLVFLPILLTGGLHLDGLSDFLDGFMSARADREEILRIMKDARTGVMGVLGIWCVLMAKYELLVVVGANWLLYAFALAASRTVPVILGYRFPYAGGPTGMGKDFVGSIEKKDLALSVVVAGLIGLPLGLFFFIFVAGLLGLLIWMLGTLAKKRIGGVTGDILGAATELSEVLILLVASGMAIG